jgi:hypothetical protein
MFSVYICFKKQMLTAVAMFSLLEACGTHAEVSTNAERADIYYRSDLMLTNSQ